MIFISIMTVVGFFLLGVLSALSPIPGVAVLAALRSPDAEPAAMVAALAGDLVGQMLVFFLARRVAVRFRRDDPAAVPASRSRTASLLLVLTVSTAGRFIAVARVGIAPAAAALRTPAWYFFGTAVIGTLLEAGVVELADRNESIGVLRLVGLGLLLLSAAVFILRVERARKWLLNLRRLPATITITAALIVVAVVSGSAWQPVEHRAWWNHLTLSATHLAEGHWWVSVTSLVVLPNPLASTLVLLIIPALVRLERTRGTAETLRVFLRGELVAAAVVLLTVMVFSATGWPWPSVLAGQVLVVPLAGMSAAVTAALTTLTEPWRFRSTLLVLVAAAVGVLIIGTADLLGCFAAALSVVIAQQTHQVFRFTLRQWRNFAGIMVLATAAIPIIVAIRPVDGPFGQTPMTLTPWWSLAFTVLVALAVAWPLHRGSRAAWWVAVTLSALHLVVIPVFIGAVLLAVPHADVGADLGGSVLWVVVAVVLLVGRNAFSVRAAERRRGVVAANTFTRQAATTALQRVGGGTLSWMTTWERIEYLPVDGGYVGLQQHGDVAIALGDPVVPEGATSAALQAFADRAEQLAAVPCVFSASEVSRAAMPAGWRSILVAEDTIVDLPTLELTGKRWQPARGALNRAEREGISFRMTRLIDEEPATIAQVRAISESWVDDKALPEMGFTLGTVKEALDPAVRVALACDSEGLVHGVLSWLPVYGPEGTVQGWTLDLMRRRQDGFGPVMEYLITESALQCQREGALFLSLSGAPLTGDSDEPGPVQRLVDGLGRLIEPVYGFRSLHRFKQKFNPRAEPLWLLYRDDGDLPRIAFALGRAFLPDATARDFLRAGIDLARP